jgi:hypothetical protein
MGVALRIVCRTLAAFQGRKVDSDSALAHVEEKYRDAGAFGVAEMRAFRGEVDQAFRWLDRAYIQRNAEL